MAQLLELINTNSTNALRVWCFTEALRTQDRDALRLWLAEWEKADTKKKEGVKNGMDDNNERAVPTK